MVYISGVIFAVLCVVAAMIHLEQKPEMLWDFVAFAVVLGGTFAVAIITLPWRELSVIRRLMWKFLVPAGQRRRHYIKDSMRFVQSLRMGAQGPMTFGTDLPGQVLRDGAELIQLGLAKGTIEEILAERIYQTTQRGKHMANRIRSLAKYPPAFGLAGTVLGLIHLMVGISKGMNPQETGVLMAIALMATFYGLMTANLFVNPMGERLLEVVEQDEKLAEIGLRAVLLAAEGSRLLEAQEILNSYVEVGERVDSMNDFDDFVEGAA